MDENDLRAVSDAMNELRESGTLSAESLTKLSGSGDTAKKGLEKFSNQLLGVGQKLGGLAGEVAKGEGTFASMGGTIEQTTKLMGGLLSALPLVGGAAKALAEGVGQASKFVLDQLDTMAKNYQTLGDASAGAVDGIDGLYRQFTQMGNYSLPAFTKAIKNNTLGLAALRGTAALGAEELSNIAGALTTGQVAERFLKLGISLDSVGDIAAEYAANMSRYGLTQGDTTDQLIAKTQNYIVEVDKIARLTGQSRQAQEQVAQKNLADSRYRAKISEMRARGQVNEAKQLELFVRGLGAINPALADAARATVTGTYLTKQAAETDIVLNGAIRRNLTAIEQGADAAEALADAQDAAGAGADRFRTLFKYGKDLGGVGVAVFDTEALLLRRNELESQGLSRADDIAQVQKEQMEASGDLTDDFTKAQLAVANSSKNVQKLGFSLAIQAVPAVEAFAEGLESVTEFINDRFGGLSSKKSDAQNQENWNNMKSGSKALHLIAVGLEEAADFAGLNTIAKKAREARLESETKEFASTRVVGGGQARAKAESYYGKKISDDEYSALVKATHAEAAGGKQASQREQAMIMASILNRARTDQGGIIGALTAKNQFQSVTGTAADGNRPSKQFLTGPDKDRLQSIEGATDFLEKISREQKNFTAASSAAYGAGTNIGYRDKMLATGGKVIGGTVFQTDMTDVAGPSGRYKSPMSGVTSPSSAGTETTAKSNQATEEQQANGFFDKFGKKLDEMIAQQRQTNAINSKILQQAKA